MALMALGAIVNILFPITIVVGDYFITRNEG